MKESKRKFWKLSVVSVLGVIVTGTLILYFMIIRHTMYAESSQHLDEVSRQIAISIEKQTYDQWNMLDMLYYYFSDVSEGEHEWDDLEAFVLEQKEKWAFDSLCFVDQDAMYYDGDNYFSLLSHKEVSSELLTKRRPVILDNTLFKDGNKLIFLNPIDDLVIDGKTFQAIGG